MTFSLPWPVPQFMHSESDAQARPALPRSKSLQSLLRHYETPGVQVAPNARVNPTVRRREMQPLRLWDLWKYGYVFAHKATSLATDVMSHGIWGPRKKSWGIEMTIITSLMRDVGRHSALVDIATIRLVMSVTGFIPIPSDAIVTPVTFRVRQRGLRGLLAEHDARETGSRELSGEWVVGKKLWHRLQADWKAANDVAAGKAPPRPESKPRSKQKHRVVLYLHGGAYYLSSASSQRIISIPLSKYADARVFALDYRLAPETCFPGPLHDAVCAYLRLVEDLHIPPENIILAGDSAGGGLSLALLLYLRDNNYPLPSGAVLMSPWVDLTMSCESLDSNAAFDVVPMPAAPDDHLNPVSLYLGEGMQQYLTHPYASPLFGDFRGLPPLLIQAGDAEVLRDEITLLAHKASRAGVEVQHELYEDAIHVFQAYPFLEAAHRSFMSCRDFVRNTIPRWQGYSPRSLAGDAEAELEHEIDNEKARVVRGDGVESVESPATVEEEMAREEKVNTAHSHADAEAPARNAEEVEEDESWQPSRDQTSSQLPSPPMSAAEDDDDDDDAQPDVDDALPPSLSRSDAPGLRRIKSAISVLSADLFNGRSVHPPLAAGTERNHRRTPSHRSGQSQHGATTPGSQRGSPPERPERNHRRTPSGFGLGLSMSSVSSPPPSPSVRKRAKSTSHPDITSLVEQWSHDGPANRTRMYKPQMHR